MIQGLYYCVEVDYIVLSTTSTASSTSTTSATTAITTPTPTQTGIASNCDKFYLVVSGDTCSNIATAEGISLNDFYAWNPAVGTTCATLFAGYYVCVGVTSTTTPTTLQTSTITSGVTTPTPIQTGVTASCDKFYLVVSGDSCSNIATAEGISLANFYAWNPAVGSTCATLYAGYYVCVGISGSTASATTVATTTTGNGIVTPTPTQAGMVSDCDVFHLVVSGDTCSAISTAAGVSLTDFYSWNPAVGSTCATLFIGYYVCIGVSGTATTTLPPTTTTGNGVVTPTPIQTGMVANCDVFHLVVSGDTCYDISVEAGVALATFYSWNPAVGSTCATLFLGYYVCIGIL